MMLECSADVSIRAKKLLIITSSGGGGLIQAANAKAQEAQLLDPNILIVRKDVLKDWLGGPFGFGIKLWNEAQIKGNVAALRFLIAMQRVFDVVCWPVLFFCTLYTLFKEDPDEVMDFQPIGVSAIIKAIRLYNNWEKKQIFLQLIVVDLPTKSATHFFRPVKALSHKDRRYLILTTIEPLLENGQTSEEFWQENCGLSEQDVNYEDVYVRQSFKKYQNKEKVEKDFPVFVRFQSNEELFLIRKIYEKGFLRGCIERNTLHFVIPASAYVVTILLGSQPASEATVQYVKQWIQLAKETKRSHQSICLFVFCSALSADENCLFRRISTLIGRMKKYPRQCTVIPFSFQNDDVIASLFFRSDITCTRSGGQTAMELMSVRSGDMWIHSETKKGTNEILSLEQLLKGIPGWEAANALYLQKVRDAKIVTPETFRPFARQLLITPAANKFTFDLRQSAEN